MPDVRVSMAPAVRPARKRRYVLRRYAPKRAADSVPPAHLVCSALRRPVEFPGRVELAGRPSQRRRAAGDFGRADGCATSRGLNRRRPPSEVSRRQGQLGLAPAVRRKTSSCGKLRDIHPYWRRSIPTESPGSLPDTPRWSGRRSSASPKLKGFDPRWIPTSIPTTRWKRWIWGLFVDRGDDRTAGQRT